MITRDDDAWDRADFEYEHWRDHKEEHEDAQLRPQYQKEFLQKQQDLLTEYHATIDAYTEDTITICLRMRPVLVVQEDSQGAFRISDAITKELKK